MRLVVKEREIPVSLQYNALIAHVEEDNKDGSQTKTHKLSLRIYDDGRIHIETTGVDKMIPFTSFVEGIDRAFAD